MEVQSVIMPLDSIKKELNILISTEMNDERNYVTPSQIAEPSFSIGEKNQTDLVIIKLPIILERCIKLDCEKIDKKTQIINQSVSLITWMSGCDEKKVIKDLDNYINQTQSMQINGPVIDGNVLLISKHTGCNKNTAKTALLANKGDVVQAILQVSLAIKASNNYLNQTQSTQIDEHVIDGNVLLISEHTGCNKNTAKTALLATK